ncbi:MAG: hypothetical protein D6814_07630 [Calditrichaeota bacterium]|nr:MAG: hypothetical protein D6814_07630 [Calditrichota bacterium]
MADGARFLLEIDAVAESSIKTVTLIEAMSRPGNVAIFLLILCPGCKVLIAQEELTCIIHVLAFEGQEKDKNSQLMA